MKRIDPFKNVSQALKSLDNGGRFYNILTKADDGVINKAELGKVGGIFNDKQQMILFLEMAMLKLSKSDKDLIISKLEEELQKAYRNYKPQALLPSEAKSKGVIASNAVITGIPKLVDSKSDFNGFIMIPLMAGNVTAFSMVPIIDEYDVYELRDELTDDTFMIAHLKNEETLPDKKVIIGGILKEIKESEIETEASGKFLEAIFHLDY